MALRSTQSNARPNMIMTGRGLKSATFNAGVALKVSKSTGIQSDPVIERQGGTCEFARTEDRWGAGLNRFPFHGGPVEWETLRSGNYYETQPAADSNIERGEYQ